MRSDGYRAVGRSIIVGLIILALSLLSVYAEAPIDPQEIEKAVAKGVQALLEKQVPSRALELVVYTLLQAGVPKTNPVLQSRFQEILTSELRLTYNVSLLAIALEKYDRKEHQDKIALCAQALVDGQCVNGQWSYQSKFRQDLGMGFAVAPAPDTLKKTRHRKATQSDDTVDSSENSTETAQNSETTSATTKPTEPERPAEIITVVRTKKPQQKTGDNPSTENALSGLWAAVRSGVVIPEETWKNAAAALKEQQRRDGSWSYGRSELKDIEKRGDGCMTGASLYGLAIAEHFLKEDIGDDEVVRKGLAWFIGKIRFDDNPGTGYDNFIYFGRPKALHYCYLYNIQRVAALFNLTKINNYDWYQEGARYLLDHQKKDGSWNEPADDLWSPPIADTCFAILFLKKDCAGLELVSLNGFFIKPADGPKPK